MCQVLALWSHSHADGYGPVFCKTKDTKFEGIVRGVQLLACEQMSIRCVSCLGPRLVSLFLFASTL